MRVLLIAFIVLTITTLPAMADTLTVDGSGGADYRSIQQAVNNATSGDTILVYPGNYTESVYINKKITILSKSGNTADTIVNAAITSDSWLVETDDVFNVNADGVVISGFSMTGATIDEFGMDQAGVHLDRAHNCTIRNNYMSNNQGILLTQSYNNTLANNNITRNKLNGISLRQSSNNTIEKNRVNANGQEGILLYSLCNNNTIKNNSVSFNRVYGMTVIAYCKDNVFEGNTVSDNGVGIAVDTNNASLFNNTAVANSQVGIMVTGKHNLINSNTATSNPTGILLNHARNCTVKHNLAFNNDNGISLMRSTGNELDSNNASNNSRYGIYIKNSSKQNVLISNIAFSNKEENVYIEDMKNNTIRDEERMPFMSSLFSCLLLLVVYLIKRK